MKNQKIPSLPSSTNFNFSDQKQKQLITEFYKNCEQNVDWKAAERIYKSHQLTQKWYVSKMWAQKWFVG